MVLPGNNVQPRGNQTFVHADFIPFLSQIIAGKVPVAVYRARVSRRDTTCRALLAYGELIRRVINTAILRDCLYYRKLPFNTSARPLHIRQPKSILH